MIGKNKFGDLTEPESREFQVFLPECYSKITEDMISKMNEMNNVYFKTWIGHNKSNQITIDIQNG